MNFGFIDPISDEVRMNATNAIGKEIALSNQLHDIKQDTSDINQRLANANERIRTLSIQLDDANAELRKVRNECDTVNKQFMEYQIDSQKRDADNAKDAREAKWIAILSAVIALASFVFQMVHG